MLKGLIILGLIILLVGFVINAIRKALGHFQNEANPKNTPQNQMLPCKQCGTFVSIDDSFSHKGAHFCSKECLDLSLKNG
ncbi:PP0621 family protein [Helicobacter sp. T3_23-1056]